MNKTLNIWGRDFDLEIYFDCYTGETISIEQKKALDLFLQNPQLISEAKEKVITYCLKRNAAEIGGTIENIFKYLLSFNTDRRKIFNFYLDFLVI